MLQAKSVLKAAIEKANGKVTQWRACLEIGLPKDGDLLSGFPLKAATNKSPRKRTTGLVERSLIFFSRGAKIRN